MWKCGISRNMSHHTYKPKPIRQIAKYPARSRPQTYATNETQITDNFTSSLLRKTKSYFELIAMGSKKEQWIKANLRYSLGMWQLLICWKRATAPSFLLSSLFFWKQVTIRITTGYTSSGEIWLGNYMWDPCQREEETIYLLISAISKY